MKLSIDFDGEPNSLRRELRNAFRLVEREAAPEPVDQRVTITVTDQPSPARRAPMGTTRMRSDQAATIDPDFKGRLSGQNVDLEVQWSIDDPEDIAAFDEVKGDGDRSVARVTPIAGSGGIVTVTWTAQNGSEMLTGSETFEIEGEAVVFAGQTVNVTDQSALGTPAA
ncbi:MAG: hypothetical protein K0R61_3059 [Microvirga sp.]|jgi:hypothetical protein|nr:hypothetical protein [Microvirga sp.]MDF2972609.1 hypothetical protein [Microvirga sp.]